MKVDYGLDVDFKMFVCTLLVRERKRGEGACCLPMLRGIHSAIKDNLGLDDMICKLLG